MKTWIATLFISIISTLSAYANLNPNKSSNAFDHLYEVNKEWMQQVSIAPQTSIQFLNDVDRIAYHLTLVEQALREKTSDNLNSEQRKKRSEMLDILHSYAQAKQFPTNSYHAVRTPYFIDDFGVHCAVGYLIMRSGHGALSQQIRKEHNYDYIRDIQTEGVTAWAETFGFTLDELAWIQPTYPADGTYTTLGQGVNGTVKSTCIESTTGKLIYAGAFTQIDGSIGCLGVGYYQNGTLECIGGGLMGSPNHVYEAAGKIVVSGAIEVGPAVYSHAVYVNNVWSYVAIPGREGKIGVTAIDGGSNFEREVVISNDQGQNEHEVWRLNNGSWTLIGTANGPINSIAISPTEIAYAGDFDLFVANINGSSTSISTQNAIIRTSGTNTWRSLDGQIAEEVFKVKWSEGNFFFAGRAEYHSDGPTNSFSTTHADSVASIYSGVIYPPDFDNHTTIYDFEFSGDSTVVVCGEFLAGWMYYGRNVAEISYHSFETHVNQGYPVATASSTKAIGNISVAPARALSLYQSTLYVGGEMSDISYLAKLDQPLKVSTLKKTAISVYPNPATELITVKSPIAIESIQIVGVDGRQATTSKTNQLDVSELKAGNYVIRITLENGEIRDEKIVIL